jgi:glycerophosphoryl diester phosphodiesterase
MEDGAEGIEFDVRLARDGVPVVIHDGSLKRTASIDRLVSELSAEELQKIDVGGWFTRGSASTPSYSGENLPSLAQVLELFHTNRGLLYLEMKADAGQSDALAAAVARRLRETDILPQVVVECFELSAIKEIKRIYPEIRTAALFEPRLSRPISTLRRLRMIDLALDAGADEIALHHTLASSGVIEKAIASGLETVVWTVDDPKWIARARSLGIKALISNDPAAMVQHRNLIAT